ncbi:conserved hypothetical protein [Capnocytophaga canimorsus]|nr:conserved hypothetical protein [Capnocytophaga canimorsus]
MQVKVQGMRTKIADKQSEIAKEKNKFEMKKMKGKLSPNDEIKYKERILKKEQQLNKLNTELFKLENKAKRLM